MKRYRMWLLMVLAVGTIVAAQDLVIIDMTPGPPEVRITPAEPTSRDEVFATYSIAVPNPGYGLECVDVQFIANQIWLTIRLVPPPPDTAWIQVISEAEVSQSLGHLDPGTYTAYAHVGDPDSHTRASTTFTVQDAGSPPPPAPGMPEWVEQRRSQIQPTFDPGTYTLHVTNHGPVSGSASTTFTVTGPGHAIDPIQNNDRPWWWAAMRGDATG